jgi:hypothetical protein
MAAFANLRQWKKEYMKFIRWIFPAYVLCSEAALDTVRNNPDEVTFFMEGYRTKTFLILAAQGVAVR